MILIKYQLLPTQKIAKLDIFEVIGMFGSHLLKQTKIIKTNIFINYIINYLPNHYIHQYFPILVNCDQQKNRCIIF